MESNYEQQKKLPETTNTCDDLPNNEEIAIFSLV